MAQNIEEFRDSLPVGDLGIVPLEGCFNLGQVVDGYITEYRKERD